MSKGKQHVAEFKAQVALEALKGEQTFAEEAACFRRLRMQTRQLVESGPVSLMLCRF